MRAEPTFNEVSRRAVLRLLEEFKVKLTSSGTGSSLCTSRVRSFQCCHGHCCIKSWLSNWKFVLDHSDAVWSSQKTIHSDSVWSSQKPLLLWIFLSSMSKMAKKMLDHIMTGDETWISWITLETKRQALEWHHLRSNSTLKTFNQTLSAIKMMATVFGNRHGVILCAFMHREETTMPRLITKISRIVAHNLKPPARSSVQ